MSLLMADFVAKVGGPLQVRNFRIQRARRLNQCCAAGLFFESMLRVRMRKFFLQQYRHIADNTIETAFVRYWGAASTDRRNTSVKSLCWGFKLQGLAWSLVELTRYFVEMSLRVHRQVGALRKVLPQ